VGPAGAAVAAEQTPETLTLARGLLTLAAHINARQIAVKTISGDRTPNSGAPRLRIWARRAVSGEPPKSLSAKFVDGPLSGSTREVVAVEGRPPKTLDVEFDDRKLRYCLAEWEQSGHSALYGFLYDV
jgi:hypothetical protein